MRMKLPHLSPTAKAQLWGMCVGGATAFYAASKLQLGLGLFAVGWGGAWVLGEFIFGKRLIGKSDAGAIALGVASGIAFPWAGFALAMLANALRP
jgi:hypothetical protein